MHTIKRILFPIDFSASCRATARYVEAFAGQFEAEVMLLHAVGMGEHTLAEELLPRRKAQLAAYLADEFKYFETHRVCEIGTDPAAVIINVAARWKPDIVMMPTHGLATFQRLFLGSVTTKVLRELECPVWTDAHLEAPPRLEEIHVRKVLCSLDLGERSEEILDWAEWIAKQFNASLGITHAAVELPVAHYGWAHEGEYASRVAEKIAQRIEFLEKRQSVAAELFVDGGDPLTVTTEAARRFGADLMVIGRHAGGSGHLREHAYALIREAACPIISV